MKRLVNLEEIRNARLHTIYIIDVDEARVQETDPGAYTEKAGWSYRDKFAMKSSWAVLISLQSLLEGLITMEP